MSKSHQSYSKEQHKNLKYKFNGSKSIECNRSQAFQDLFVLSILNGKRNGTYVEIGGDHPINISNTYLLETDFDWSGISFELNADKVQYYNTIRKNPCICTDATSANYSEIFEEYKLPKTIDYLQVDIEPAWQTLNALKKLPLNEYSFSVITYETDLYNGGEQASLESHKLLTDYGYKLVVKNVANQGLPYENWYVKPELVDSSIVALFENTTETPKEAITCVLTY